MPSSLAEYAKLCAITLAKAHARSGNRRGLAAYLERQTGFIDTMQEQALLHADQAEQDHSRLVASMAAQA